MSGGYGLSLGHTVTHGRAEGGDSLGPFDVAGQEWRQVREVNGAGAPMGWKGGVAISVAGRLEALPRWVSPTQGPGAPTGAKTPGWGPREPKTHPETGEHVPRDPPIQDTPPSSPLPQPQLSEHSSYFSTSVQPGPLEVGGCPGIQKRPK